MKGKKLVLSVGLLLSICSLSAQDINITLQKAIDIALAENPTIRVADKEIELKRIADKEAWQALIPELSANASIQHTLLAAEMNLGGNKFKMGSDNRNTAAVCLTRHLHALFYSIHS